MLGEQLPLELVGGERITDQPVLGGTLDLGGFIARVSGRIPLHVVSHEGRAYSSARDGQPRIARVRMRRHRWWLWTIGGVVAAVLVVVAIIAIPIFTHRDQGGANQAP